MMRFSRLIAMAALMAVIVPVGGEGTAVMFGASALAAGRQCTENDVPAAERKKRQSDYVARRLLHGRTKADAWVREEGLKSRARLEAAGVCGSNTRAAPVPSARKDRSNGKQKCRMVSRPISGPNGITMAMVPKCD